MDEINYLKSQTREVSIRMKRCDNSVSMAALAVVRKYIYTGILAILPVIFVGCATAPPPMPVTIRHERTPSMSDISVYNQQNQSISVVAMDVPPVEQMIQKKPADDNVSHVDLKPWKEPDNTVTSVDLRARQENVDDENSPEVEPPQQEAEEGSAPAVDQQKPEEPVDEGSAPSVEPTRNDVDEDNGPTVDQETHEKPADEQRMQSVNQQKEEESLDKSSIPSVDQSPREKTEKEDNVSAVDQQAKKEPVDQSIVALVALLKEKNLISADEATQIIEKSEAQSTVAKKSIQDQVRSEVQDQVNEVRDLVKNDVQDQVKTEVRNQVKSEVGEELPKEINKVERSMPEWIKRIRFGGDIRLRYENDRFDKNNALTTNINQGIDTQTLQNSWANADHFKYRIRLGTGIAVNDQMEVVVRLATGNITTPVSTNTILGDFMNKDNIVFDLAYLKWQPNDLITIYGGRIPNPWFTPTWLVWDDDLNFEGLALHVRKPVSESWTTFLTAGAFPLQHVDPADVLESQHSKWLFGGQLGLEKKNQTGISAKIGAAYYHYLNITGKLNSQPDKPNLTDWSSPLFVQRGNTLFYIDATNSLKVGLASAFRELNLGGSIDIGFWDPYHIVFVGDYVKNFGFNQSKVNALVGDIDPDKDGLQRPKKYTTGYQIGMSIGHPSIEQFGQWRTHLQYKYVGADAVVDAFTDSDFHLGGTNAKGWLLAADFGLRKNTWLTLKWLTANEIDGPQLAIDVLFLDINARF
jgi:hypothetical protein